MLLRPNSSAKDVPPYRRHTEGLKAHEMPRLRNSQSLVGQLARASRCQVVCHCLCTPQLARAPSGAQLE